MQSLNPAADCAGAVRAAEEYSGEWPVQHTGYRLGREEAPKHFFRRTAITSPYCQEFMV